MHKKQVIYTATMLGWMSPLLALAAGIDNVNDLARYILWGINTLIGLSFALAVLSFFYGLALYLFRAGDTQANAQGRNLMIWGVVALFVMTSIWGLVGLLQATFDVDNQESPGYLQLEVGGSGQSTPADTYDI